MPTLWKKKRVLKSGNGSCTGLPKLALAVGVSLLKLALVVPFGAGGFCLPLGLLELKSRAFFSCGFDYIKPQNLKGCSP